MARYTRVNSRGERFYLYYADIRVEYDIKRIYWLSREEKSDSGKPCEELPAGYIVREDYHNHILVLRKKRKL